MNGSKEFSWQKPVAGHGIENARLAKQHHEHHARESRERSGGDEIGSIDESAITERDGERSFDVDRLPGHHAGQNGSDKYIENRAAQKRGNDPDGKVALGVFRFLRG